MDVDAYVTAHQGEWRRLDQLARRRRRLSGAEADELVGLYQRVATHLSVIQSSSPDAALVAHLSTVVARARSAVAGTHTAARKDIARFFTAVYPAAVYRAARWWVSVGVAFVLVSFVVAVWVATHRSVQASIATQRDIRRLVDHQFKDYYSSHPAGSFAAQVATNNAWVTALVLALGVLIVPVLWILWTNALNVGIDGGLMAASGKTDIFFGLILPHGLLELTCVFIASGAGLRIGWAWIDPGLRSRSQALMQAGLAAGAIAIGLACTLAVSGMLEAFVTPSGLPTWARVAIGTSVWVSFLSYVFVLGGRAARAGETGAVSGAGATDTAPVAA
jgi:uncharacterized membrane protein SpoIIM required for sporulation